MEQTILIAFFGGLLLLGYLGLFLSEKIRISHITIIILIGVILRFILDKTNRFPSIDLTIIFGIAFLYLVIYTFDSASKPSVKHVDTTHTHSLKLFIINLIISYILITYLLILILKLSILEASIFSIILSSSIPLFFLESEGKVQNKLAKILTNEKTIAVPILLMAVYALYDNYSIKNGVINLFSKTLTPYLLEIIVGIGIGVIISIIFFKTIKTFHKNKASPIIVFLTALGSFVLTEILGGDGFAGLATFAVIFGNMHIEEKSKTLGFFEDTILPLELIILLLTSIIIAKDITLQIIIYSILLLIILLSVRYISINYVFKDAKHTKKENLYLTLNAQIGAPMIIILLLIATNNYANLEQISLITLLIILYSSIISTIAERKATNLN